MAKGTSEAPVVRVHLEAHGNADSLSVVRVGHYTVCVRTEDWRESDLAVFVHADSVLPEKPEYAFVGSGFRVRPRRFRGVMSHGVLLPAPGGLVEGDDAAPELGITRYEPPEVARTGGNAESPPSLHVPHYDLEPYLSFPHLLVPGERVIVTEKIHGANARFVAWENRLWAGSRRLWWKDDTRNVWWKALRQADWLRAALVRHPGTVVYGEVYGQVQSLRYGAEQGEVFFRAFDVYESSRDEWWSYDRIAGVMEEGHRVPVLYDGPFDPETTPALADGRSMLAKHAREGCVIRPAVERRDDVIGRVVLKCVSYDLLSKGR